MRGKWNTCSAAWNTVSFPEVQAFRIVRPVHAASALSGEGARLHGGRWNPPGWRCVYAAESRALAVLEMLVHLTGATRSLSYRLLTLEFDDSLVGRSAPLPSGWDQHPAGSASQNIGLEWLRSARSAALRVPSVLLPEEGNFLINPSAPGFEEIRITEEREFQLDFRFADRAAISSGRRS